MAVREWSEKQIALMKWLSLPGDDLMGKGKGLRNPPTLAALARKLGVDRSILYDWQDLAGWDDAFIVVAERTFKGLTPRFLTTLAAGLMKPGAPGYDRLVQANVRYATPTIEEHESSGLWDRILPETNKSDNKELIYRRGTEKLRQLPLEDQERFMSIWADIHNDVASEENILTERPSIQVRRMTTKFEDELEAEAEAEEQEEYVLDVPGLSYNTAITITSQCRDNTTPSPIPPRTPKFRPPRKSKRSYM
jgi:hypothetical protein